MCRWPRSSVQQAAVELRRKRADLETQFESDAARISVETSADRISLEEVAVRPKKSDIDVGEVVLAWTPWSVGSDGDWQPTF